MALGYDGSVRIKADMTTRDFDKGINSMSSTLKRFGKVVLAAFSTAAVVNFAKEAISAASDLSNAWQGLQSIVEGQGRSFDKAKSFIEDYISDGLVPLENAVTAYKNLAARGYDDEQIQKTLVALKDAAAFGRQASYSLGDAVTSATEGLKNENSILVDNAGVTKNVAKMWDEYAASIGTTANNLTQEQKIQAEVNGILQETRFQTGDAAKVAGTYSGQVASLGYNFQNLKVAVGNALIPIAQAVLPGINAIIAGLTRLANVFASVTSLLFGKSAATAGVASTQSALASTGSAAADSANELADAEENAGNAAKQAEKDMKGVLAGFDELNILADNTASNLEDASGGLSGLDSDLNLPAQSGGTLFGNVEINPKIAEFVDDLKEKFSGLLDSLKPFGEKIGDGLQWLWENVLKPLGEWVWDDYLPAWLDATAAEIDFFTQVITALEPYAQWLWDNFLKPIAEWTGGVIIDVLGELTDLLRDLEDLLDGDISFEDFIGQLSDLQIALLGLAGALAAFKAIKDIITFIDIAKKTFSEFGKVVDWVFGPGSTIAGIAGFIGGVMLYITELKSMLEDGFDWVKEALMLVGIALAGVFAVVLGAPALVAGVAAAITAAVSTAAVLIKEHWEEIKEWFIEAWEKIKETAGKIWSWFDVNVIQPVGKYFSDLWDDVGSNFIEVWDGIKNVAKKIAGWFSENVITPIKNNFRGFMNTLIGFAEGFVNYFIRGINNIIGAFNKINVSIPDWVPGVGGKSFGINISRVAEVKLPRLANGAVIPPNQQFAAILGDQRSGKNIEAPAGLIESIVSRAVSEAMAAGGNTQPLQVNVMLDKKVLARAMVREVNDMTRAAGRPVLDF